MALRAPKPQRMISLAFVTAALAGSVAWAIDGSMRDSLESLDDMRLIVSTHAGTVELKTDGIEQVVSVGAVVGLPARIVTGADGSLGIRQQRTSITIAADSDVEIPALAGQGQLIARLVQRRGNVFYDVETRPANKLNVETPYLAAVVKGTQFNVSVDDERTMISLFEGQLEIRTPDGGQRIDLEAGEIAIRSRTDAAIRIVSMNAVVTPEQGLFRVDDPNVADTAVRLDARGEATVQRGALATMADAELLDGGLTTGIELGVDAGADLGTRSASISLDAGADLGAGSVDLGLDAGAELGAGGVDLGLEATLDLGIDGGGAELDTGLTTQPIIDPSGSGLPDLTPDNELPGQALPPVPSL